MKRKVVESALAAAGGCRATRTLLDTQLTLNSAQPNQMKRNGKSTPMSSIVRLEEVGGADMSFAEMPASTSIGSHLTIHIGKIKSDLVLYIGFNKIQ